MANGIQAPFVFEPSMAYVMGGDENSPVRLVSSIEFLCILSVALFRLMHRVNIRFLRRRSITL
jgi:hypothetical protein